MMHDEVLMVASWECAIWLLGSSRVARCVARWCLHLPGGSSPSRVERNRPSSSLTSNGGEEEKTRGERESREEESRAKASREAKTPRDNTVFHPRATHHRS